MSDDRLLLENGGANRSATLDQMQALGVDTVRSLLRWNSIAPNPTSTTKPSSFDAENPAAYSATNWDVYDDLVRETTARGMSLLLVPTGSSPYWSSQCSGSKKKIRSCKPNPTEYKRFMTAVGKRYSGQYLDENQGGELLPKVSRWSIWNEPGIAGWLYPQFEKKSGSIVPTSPITYRKLVYAAGEALAATGHSRDQIILGEFQPIGSTKGSLAKRTMAPGLFIRELFCLDERGKRYKSSAAKRRGCSGSYKKLPVNAVSIHPYTSAAAQPPLTKTANKDDINFSTLSRLPKLMKLGAKSKRIKANLPILITEYGIQTSPPEPSFYPTTREAAEYLNQSDYIAYRNKDIDSVAQYELADESNSGGFQTGLLFNNMSQKPGWEAYRLPIYAVKSGSKSTKIYGQLRPATSGITETLEIQHKDSSGEYETVKTTKLNNLRHNFLTTIKAVGGSWRIKWQPSGSSDVIYSREAKVRSR